MAHESAHLRSCNVYRDLWRGIDVRFRGAGRKLKYEFLLSPGARRAIGLAYAGARRSPSTARGNLLIHTPLGTLRRRAAGACQWIGGHRVPVESRFAARARRGRAYGFALGAYDRQLSARDRPGARLLDLPGRQRLTTTATGSRSTAAGSAYVTGQTRSANFPTTRAPSTRATTAALATPS